VRPIHDIGAAADDAMTVQAFLAGLERRGRGFDVPGGP
jgi:hypothetical protein